MCVAFTCMGSYLFGGFAMLARGSAPQQEGLHPRGGRGGAGGKGWTGFVCWCPCTVLIAEFNGIHIHS